MKYPRFNATINYKKVLGKEEWERIRDILEKQNHPKKNIKEDIG